MRYLLKAKKIIRLINFDSRKSLEDRYTNGSPLDNGIKYTIESDTTRVVYGNIRY